MLNRSKRKGFKIKDDKGEFIMDGRAQQKEVTKFFNFFNRKDVKEIGPWD